MLSKLTSDSINILLLKKVNFVKEFERIHLLKNVLHFHSGIGEV